MMSERVYPRDSPPVSGEHPNSKQMVESPPDSGQYHRPTMSQESFTSSKMSYNYNYGPQPGTYVVQVPKDQIYKVPPPENAHKYQLYTKKHGRRNRGCCCLCSIIASLVILALLFAIACGIFYVIYSPKAPSYSIENVQVKGVNLSLAKSTATISPVFNVTVKTVNKNGKIGIHYEKGSDVKIYHDGVNLCEGGLPAFYQAPKSVTTFSTTLSGPGIVLSKSARDKLVSEQKSGRVPLHMDVKVPVKIKVGSINTWTITVKVSCDVTLNAMAPNAKVVSKSCKVNAKPW